MNGARPTIPAGRLVYVLAGRACLGHVINRGRDGAEAFDRGDKSVGLFATLAEAAAALAQNGAAP